jgi:iron complex outermembrane recepter protein
MPRTKAFQFRHHRLVSSLALIVAMAPAAAYAQSDVLPAEVEEIAAPEATDIVVTGSRIARRGLESSSPTTVVSSEEFQLTGAVNVEQVINALPQVVPGVTAFSNNPGAGVATLDLRGLGNQRTLVLVDGRRYIFFDPTQTVDVNNIPQFLLESVDVVTGGASAVYGSDAIAGVVNFRLRNDLQGLTVGTQYALAQGGLSGRGRGDRFNVNVALGSDILDGAGHVTLFGEYFNRKVISQADRWFSRQVLVENSTDTGLVPGGSATVPGGRFAIAGSIVVPAGNGLGSVTLNRGTGNFATASGSLYTAPGVSRPYVEPTDAYNFAQDNFLQVPQERWLAGAYGNYEISPAINPYIELTFANNRVQNELAPTPVTGQFAVATNNPFLSAADRAALVQTDLNEAAIDAARVARGLAPQFNDPGFVNVSVNRRVNDITARNSLFERTAWRAVVGTKGDLGSGLNYDAYYLFSRTRNSTTQQGNISRSAFGNALRANRLNIFGPGTISEALADEISIVAQNSVISQLQVASASVTGELLDLGMGADAIGFAAGAEWRSVSSEFIPDTALSSGDVIGFLAGQPTKGNYSVKEVFGELLVPIIKGQTLIEELTVRGAARYGDYSLPGVGGVFTWAAGLEWAPISDIRFRGQYQKAIRAPNVGELFGGQSNNFPAATDPCSGRSSLASRTATVRSLCEATGVPAALVFQNSVQANSQIESQVGGNSALREETSETYTAGVVIRPSFVPGLSITADYYEIKVDDYIAPLGGGTQGILNLCYYGIQSAQSAYCQAIRRDPSTGQIGGQFLVTALNANISTLTTSGVDLQVDYSTRVGRGLFSDNAKLNLSFLSTWTKSADYTPVADLPNEITRCDGGFGANCEPVFGDPVPKFRFTTRATWVDGPVTASLRYRHVGGVTNERILNGTSDAASIVVDRLEPKGYVDLSFAFDVDERLQLTMGVNNLFDVTPQIIDDSNDEQASTYPSTYDVLGRDFFVSARFKF